MYSKLSRLYVVGHYFFLSFFTSWIRFDDTTPAPKELAMSPIIEAFELLLYKGAAESIIKNVMQSREIISSRILYFFFITMVCPPFNHIILIL